MKKWEPWESLDKEHKIERVALVGITVILLAFSPVYNYFNEKQIEKKTAGQNSTLLEDVNEVGEQFRDLKSEWEEMQSIIDEIKDDENLQNKEKEGDSLDTIVEKK